MCSNTLLYATPPYANSDLPDFHISSIRLPPSVANESSLRHIIETHVESLPEPDEIGNVIEEVVDLVRQITSEVESVDVQEFLDSHNQELTMDELIVTQKQDIEELESIDPVQSKISNDGWEFDRRPPFG
ncbi:hypothetical protein TNCV_4261241 [Trichonephila clavipes]|nr:hypothetical protein TNCV_4261241 [Trichonephila clavipes]